MFRMGIFMFVTCIACLYLTNFAKGQTKAVDYKLTTIAGGLNGEGVKATSVGINVPAGISVSSVGNVYFTDVSFGQVRYLDSSGNSHLVAGSPNYHVGTATDTLTLATDTLNQPYDVALNSKGEVFIAEYNATRIRKVFYNSTLGTFNMLTIAGGGSSLASNVSALSAKLNNPRCVVVAPNDDIYICDTSNFMIRKIVNQTITTVVGTGVSGASPEGALASDSRVTVVLGIAFHPVSGEMYYSDFGSNAIKYVATNGSVFTYASSTGPYDLGFDSNGDLYVSEYGANKIVKISNGTGARTVIANNGGAKGFSGDGGNALNATINLPAGLAIYGTSVYFSDSSNYRIRKIDLITNTITTVAGDGSTRYIGSSSGYRSDVALFRPETTFYNSRTDELLIVDTGNNRVLRLNSFKNINTSLIETIAGTGTLVKDDSDGKLGNQTGLYTPYSVVQSETSGDVFIGTYNRVFKLSKSSQKMSTVAGTATTLSGDNYLATHAQLSYPAGLAYAPNGDLYFCDSNNHAIRKIDSLGIITTIAGNGTAGFQDGDAFSALFNTTAGLAYLPNGDLLIADFNNNRIRKYIASSKQVITLAGGASASFSGDGGLATSALLNHPTGVCYNSTSGDILIADYVNKRIRKIANSTGIITTMAGTGATSAYLDGVAATATGIAPYGLSIHPISGELYLTDNAYYLIRRIDSTGKMYKVIGVPLSTAFSTSALSNSTGLSSISFLTFSANGDLYIACFGHNVIKKMDYGSNIVYNVAGTGSEDFNGDQRATSTNLSEPLAVAYSLVTDELVFSDYKHDRIRKVSSGMVKTIAGGIGDKGLAINAKLKAVSSLLLVDDTDLYISDAFDYKIRKVSLQTGIIDSVIGGFSNAYNGDNLANQTNINTVWDMRIRNNELIFADMANYRIRKTSLSGLGQVSTIAGIGSNNASVVLDNIKASSAYLEQPASVAFLANGEMIIAETEGHIFRKVDLLGNISLIAGSFFQAGYNGDSSDSKTCLLYEPTGLTILSDGRIIFSDFGNNRVRMLTPYCKDEMYYMTQSSQGIVCNMTSCNGIYYTDSKVCSGNGVCKSLNNCTCSAGYSGSDCSIADICSLLSNSYICSSSSLNTTETETTVTKVSNITQLNSKTIEFSSTTVTVSLPSTISQYLQTLDSSLKNETVSVVSSISSNSVTQATTEVISPVISIVMVKSSSSQTISVKNLEEPISLYFNKLNMSVSNIETLNITCMYFDESEKQWKSDGVESEITEMILHNLPDGNMTITISLTCKTYHLTSFGIIDQNYKKANSDNSADDSTILQDYTVLIGAIVGGVGGCCVLASVVVLIIVVAILIRRRQKRS